MATFRCGFLVAVFVIIVTMLSFGVYQNGTWLNGNQHMRNFQQKLSNLRNGGFIPYFGSQTTEGMSKYTNGIISNEENVLKNDFVSDRKHIVSKKIGSSSAGRKNNVNKISGGKINLTGVKKDAVDEKKLTKGEQHVNKGTATNTTCT